MCQTVLCGNLWAAKYYQRIKIADLKTVLLLPALSQIMLFVDGMNGIIAHNETLQWLYTLSGSVVSLLLLHFKS